MPLASVSGADRGQDPGVQAAAQVRSPWGRVTHLTLPSPPPTSRSGFRTSGNQRRQRRRVDYAANPGTLLPVQPIGIQVSLAPRPCCLVLDPGEHRPELCAFFLCYLAPPLLSRRHAICRVRHELVRRPCAHGIGEAALRGHCRNPEQT